MSRVEGFSTEAATAMVKGYTDNLTPGEYNKVFTEAFNAGKEGLNTAVLRKMAANNNVSEATLFAAYDIGREFTKNSTSVLKTGAESGIINTVNAEATNEGRQGLSLRGSVQWSNSQNTQGQLSQLESGTGQAESRGKAGGYADSEIARFVNEGREVTVAELGILGGSKYQKVRILDREHDTKDTREAREYGESRGFNVIVITGGAMHIEGKFGKIDEVNAYLLGNNMIIRADHGMFTSTQFSRHEGGHDMIAKGEVDIKAVRTRIKEVLQNDDGINEAAKHYEEAYSGTGLTADEIWEEMICDSLGDMNIFSKSEKRAEAAEVMKHALPAIQQAVAETKTEATNPDTKTEGKASRDKYWYPDLSQREWNLLNYRLDRELASLDNHIDKATKWLYADSRGIKVFAIYGIGDGTEATVLYAVGGNKADILNQRRIEYETNLNGSGRNAYKKSLERIGVEQNKHGNGVNRNGQNDSRTDKGTRQVSSGSRGGNNGGTVPSDSKQGKASRELDLDDYSQIFNMRGEANKVREDIKKIEKSEDFKAQMDKLTQAVDSGDAEGGIAAYNEWKKSSGYGELIAKRDQLEGDIAKYSKAYEDNRVNRALNEEAEAIKKSGLSEADYFRKEAEKVFGYTPYFYDAGYIVPNGKMLNFSGEKGVDKVKDVYLNITNPIFLEDLGFWDCSAIAPQLWEKGLISQEDLTRLQRTKGYMDGEYNDPASVAMRKILSDLGYDGILYANKVEGKGTLSAMALYPDQIYTIIIY